MSTIAELEAQKRWIIEAIRTEKDLKKIKDYKTILKGVNSQIEKLKETKK
ncbi:MAG: hypothetical protein LBG21_04110 [Campylobacteraceae bacterium]|jgi:hypothetical protein|nr:hypothetical protein [Campylobacteraceae bacterium]